MVYLYGLSPTESFYRHNPDDVTRGSKNAQRVSRAANKITEVIDGMGVLDQLHRPSPPGATAEVGLDGATDDEAAGRCQGNGVSALDIGASPGGWTKVLARHPAIDAVVAVDPAGESAVSQQPYDRSVLSILTAQSWFHRCTELLVCLRCRARSCSASWSARPHREV